MKKFQSNNPATGENLAIFEESSLQEIESAVNKAKKIFLNWQEVTLNERVSLFMTLKILLEQKSESLAQLITKEMGKPEGTAEFEIDDICSGIDYYTQTMINMQEQVFPVDPEGTDQWTVHLPLVPHGVIGIISPFNFPFWTPMINIVPAILTGNVIVWKPDERTNMMGQEIENLFLEAGFPPGIITRVIGGAEVGKALVQSAVDKIVITGGVDTGLDVIQNAGLKPCLLELGGNDASLVLHDADIKLAVPAIGWGATYNAGQACGGIKRVYVHEQVAKDFISHLTEYVYQLVPGTHYGPLIDEESRRRFHNRVVEAVGRGARLLAGGKIPDGPGYWYPPTILVYEDDNIELVKEETFAPMIPVRVVKSDEEALELANKSCFGLSGNIWTTNIERGRRFAMKMEAKMVSVNEALIGLPGGEHWGGWKCSGLATTEGRLETFLKRKVLASYYGDEPRSWWLP